MKYQNDLDMQIKQALHTEGDAICASKKMKDRIDEQIEQQNDGKEMVNITHMSRHRNKERTMKKINKVWIAAAAVAVCILVPTGVYAAGQITGYVSSLTLGHSYDSYEELAQAQEKAGFTFDSIESFSNGYTFSKMDVSTTDKLDGNNRVGSFNEWWGYYEKEGCPKIEMIIHEVLPEVDEYDVNATERREIDGITVTYNLDHYKFVPVDYEMTAEDEANVADLHYYISVGSDEVEESDIHFTSWNRDGIHYSLMCSDATLSVDEFFAMAEEFIRQ